MKRNYGVLSLASSRDIVVGVFFLGRLRREKVATSPVIVAVADHVHQHYGGSATFTVSDGRKVIVKIVEPTPSEPETSGWRS